MNLDPSPHLPPNTYGGGFDRLVERRTDVAWIAEAAQHIDARVLPLWRNQQPVREEGEGPRLAWIEPDAVRRLGLDAAPVLLGAIDGTLWFAADLGDNETPPDIGLDGAVRFADLREVGALLPAEEAALGATARGLFSWHTSHRFCGRCGLETSIEDAGYVLRCGGCDASHHPRIDPAVIMLVTDGDDRCVLGRSYRRPPGTYSCFAGFVEPGESLEAAVAREVREEIGLEIGDVRYHSSQPWPFPGQIMIGFTAQATSFDITIDNDEIRAARWFSRNELARAAEEGTVQLPRPDSVARRMVEDWLAERSS